MIMINQSEIAKEKKTVNVPFQFLYPQQLKYAGEGELKP